MGMYFYERATDKQIKRLKSLGIFKPSEAYSKRTASILITQHQTKNKKTKDATKSQLDKIYGLCGVDYTGTGLSQSEAHEIIKGLVSK